MKKLNFCNIVEHLKTTLLGLLFIAIPTVVLFKHGSIDIYLGAGLYLFGVLLLVSPDNVISIFLGFLKSIIEKIIGTPENDQKKY